MTHCQHTPQATHCPIHPCRANRPSANGLGIVGFLVTLLSCGLLAPFGMLLSLVGLKHERRGIAVAGTVLGMMGTAVMLTVGTAVVSLAHGFQAKVAEQQAYAHLEEANHIILQYQEEAGRLPEGIEGNKLVIQLRDPWGENLRYDDDEDVAGGFQIRSAGADGEFDTDDDHTLSPNMLRPVARPDRFRHQ